MTPFDYSFQSLFSWNLLLMSAAYDLSASTGALFQSLFSWNLLLMSSTCLARPEQGQVSILVFVELALDGRTEHRLYRLKEFQSLFSWNLLLMCGASDGPDPEVLQFQSLFSWNLLLMPIQMA